LFVVVVRKIKCGVWRTGQVAGGWGVRGRRTSAPRQGQQVVAVVGSHSRLHRCAENAGNEMHFGRRLVRAPILELDLHSVDGAVFRGLRILTGQ